MSDKTMKKRSTETTGTVLFALALIALGGFIGYETMAMSAGPEYAAVGPRSFPAFIGAGLVLVGVTLIWGLFRSEVTVEGEESVLYDWKAVFQIAAAFGLQIVALKWLGWIPTAALLFFAITKAFGGERNRATLLIGLVLASITYLVFSHVLGLSLPLGFFSAE